MADSSVAADVPLAGGFIRGGGSAGSAAIRWTSGLAALLLAGMALSLLESAAEFRLAGDSYAVLHAVLEMAAVAIAAQIAGMAWTSHEVSPNRNFIVLACLFTAAGGFDFLHLMSYQGMPDFVTPAGPSKAIYFWLAGRYAVVAALVAVVLLPWRPGLATVGRHVLATLTAGLVAAIGAVGLFQPQGLPVFFIPGQGLTASKIALEYGLVALLSVLAVVLVRGGGRPRFYHRRYLLAGVVTMAASELCFTVYANVNDLVNLLGHAYKLLSYLFIHRAVFVEQIRRPYLEIQDSENRFRRLMAAAPEGLAIVDGGGRITMANEAMERMFGWEAGALVGVPRAALVPSPLEPEAELRGRHCDGSSFPVEMTESPVTMGDDRWSLCICRDISERKRVEAAMRQQELEKGRLAAVLESSPDLVALADADHRLLYLNLAGRAMLGFAADADLAAVPIHALFGEELRQRLAQEGEACVRRSGLWRGEGLLAPVEGNKLAIDLTLIAHGGVDGDVAFWSYIAQDIDMRKRLEAQLAHQATHDSLTGLPNRTLLLDRLGQAMAHAERRQRQVGVLLVGVDGLKAINDNLGHFQGDELLQQLGRRLQETVRPGDTVARIGGDEFVVVLDDLSAASDLGPLGERLLERLGRHFEADGHVVFVTASIGATLYPLDGQDGEALLRNADLALFEAKRRGKGQLCRFEATMNRGMLRRFELLGELRHALEAGEFVLYYQPKVEFATGDICGLEALIRWQHPQRGLVPPDQFIPLAEESGLILPLGQWVLRTACAQAKAWQLGGLPCLSVAVNLSPHQFRQDDLAESVARVLRETGLAPACLELEVTESQVMDNVEHSQRVLRDLRELGVSIAIDDFGTGYSSLAYLRRLPMNCLKIDRSFVDEVPDNENDAAIAAAIISMAHRLGLRVVAEGVETERQRDFLRAQRCEEMQGYLFSRPLPALELERLLRLGLPLPVVRAAA